jgi:hypothetical protein
VLGIILAGLGWAAVLLRNSRALTLWVVAAPPCRDARGQYDSGEFKRCAYRCDIFGGCLCLFFLFYFVLLFWCTHSTSEQFRMLIKRVSWRRRRGVQQQYVAWPVSSNQTTKTNTRRIQVVTTRPPPFHPTQKRKRNGCGPLSYTSGRVMKASPAGPSRSWWNDQAVGATARKTSGTATIALRSLFAFSGLLQPHDRQQPMQPATAPIVITFTLGRAGADLLHALCPYYINIFLASNHILPRLSALPFSVA